MYRGKTVLDLQNLGRESCCRRGEADMSQVILKTNLLMSKEFNEIAHRFRSKRCSVQSRKSFFSLEENFSSSAVNILSVFEYISSFVYLNRVNPIDLS